MAAKMIRQAYPVAVEMPGGVVPAGVPVSLPKDKAERLAERFGIVIYKGQTAGQSAADLTEPEA
jgi:hypothetical protein